VKPELYTTDLSSLTRVARTNISRRIALSIVGGLVLLVVYASVYRWGMATFEGEQLGFVRSLQVVLEALTTAGFGGDAPWSSTAMNALVVAMNLTGVLLVFFAIPFFVVPLLEDALHSEVPMERSLSGHVIVCADSPRESALRSELAEMNVEPLFVKRDSDVVRDLLRDGVEAIQGDPEATRTLEGATISEAEAIIVDVNDEVNASIILAARRLAPDLRIVSVVEDRDSEAYHRYAGADEVIRPRVAVGERLATKVRGTQLSGGITDGTADDALELTEILVEPGSDLAGRTLADCAFRQQYGVTVVGGWFHGEFIAPVDADRTLVEHTVLLVVGHSEELATLNRHVTSQQTCERAVVAGYGVVGRTVAETLRQGGVEVTVVDSEHKDGVDVVGDITEPQTLDEVNLEAADSIVLALSRDSLAVYAALVVEDHTPGVQTLARADDVESVQNYYDAGVEFTLALSDVTAHMVAARLFTSGSDTESGKRYEVARLSAPELAGHELADAVVGDETGVQVLAVERDGTVHSNLGPSFEVRRSDTLILAGAETNLKEFKRTYAE
jgi:Trk K+ transport system NAD-binding subunit